MSPKIILIIFILYTSLLFLITWLTSRKSSNQAFFTGNKLSPWYIVAYGMIGASLSGVTFMSVPGWVRDTQFSYMIVVFGYLVGYIVIATILIPLYYRLNLTSIYSYLEQRFGNYTYKTGAAFFLLSRILGASLRVFLVVSVLQLFVFDSWGIPFIVTVFIFITLIILYTFEGGIKTIIWTDTLQTTFMLLAVILSIVYISMDLNFSFTGLISTVWHSKYAGMIITNWHDKRYFLKQFLSGIFITIVMTGLDQEMMQKNLSCRNLKEAQKNMFTFSAILVFVNLMFMVLGAVLLIYMDTKHIKPVGASDNIFPIIALQYLKPIAGIVFVIGLISAAYPSADGALTSLTTSFCIDILSLNKNKKITEGQKIKSRYFVHIGFALILLAFIMFFKTINDRAIIDRLFTIAGYTYGPLLGLYAFGMFTKFKLYDQWVPLVCIISPIICYFISKYSILLFSGYRFGFELLIVNGALTFIGLCLLIVRE